MNNKKWCRRFCYIELWRLSNAAMRSTCYRTQRTGLTEWRLLIFIFGSSPVSTTDYNENMFRCLLMSPPTTSEVAYEQFHFITTSWHYVACAVETALLNIPITNHRHRSTSRGYGYSEQEMDEKIWLSVLCVCIWFVDWHWTHLTTQFQLQSLQAVDWYKSIIIIDE
jgi:hypothetical protein